MASRRTRRSPSTNPLAPTPALDAIVGVRLPAPLRRSLRRSQRAARAAAAARRRRRQLRVRAVRRRRSSPAGSGSLALYRMVSVTVSYAERRSNFVAAVSHELKTPLTAIRMYGEMLRDGIVPAEAKRAEYYRHITVESERLSRLINNVLEFSRLEKGTRQMSLVTGSLGPVVARGGRAAASARRARRVRARCRRGRVLAGGALRARRAVAGALQSRRQRREVRARRRRQANQRQLSAAMAARSTWRCATTVRASLGTICASCSSPSTAARAS